MANAIYIRISESGLRETLRKFDELPKDASTRLKDETKHLAELFASKIRADGMSDAAPQSPIVAATAKVVRDRVPTVQVGGTARIGRRRKPAYKLLFGSVFGSNSYHQFHRPHAGQEGYWIFPTVDRNQGTIIAAWNKVADEIVRDFSEGG